MKLDRYGSEMVKYGIVRGMQIIEIINCVFWKFFGWCKKLEKYNGLLIVRQRLIGVS